MDATGPRWGELIKRDRLPIASRIWLKCLAHRLSTVGGVIRSPLASSDQACVTLKKATSV